jgi:hypothetical protein
MSRYSRLVQQLDKDAVEVEAAEVGRRWRLMQRWREMLQNGGPN